MQSKLFLRFLQVSYFKSFDVFTYFYLACDSVPRNDDVCNLGDLIQDDDMHCNSLQDDDDLLYTQSCFSDSYKSVAWSSLIAQTFQSSMILRKELSFHLVMMELSMTMMILMMKLF